MKYARKACDPPPAVRTNSQRSALNIVKTHQESEENVSKCLREYREYMDYLNNGARNTKDRTRKCDMFQDS